METIDAISKRVCTRRFKKKEVNKKHIEQLLDAGRRAPTARAVEPWEFVVITDLKMLASLGQMVDNGPFIADAALCIAVFCKETKYYLEDGCAATENILLQAADLGLGACWVAGDKKPYAIEVAQILGAPKDMKLVSLLPIGWPEKELEQIQAPGVSDVVHWEKF